MEPEDELVSMSLFLSNAKLVEDQGVPCSYEGGYTLLPDGSVRVPFRFPRWALACLMLGEPVDPNMTQEQKRALITEAILKSVTASDWGEL